MRTVPARVGIVVRDRKARPAPDRYNVCYVNGFQTQPDERRLWKRHPRLILRKNGRRVVDSAWGEWLLDIRTSRKRQRLLAIMRPWVRAVRRVVSTPSSSTTSTPSRAAVRCSPESRALPTPGCSSGPRTARGSRPVRRTWPGFDGRRVGYDFAVAEECGRYRECASYVAHYGRRVLSIEYRRADFTWTCDRFGDRVAVVLRDRSLSPRGVREWCPA